MTDSIVEIRKRVAAATPGPWEDDCPEISAKAPAPDYCRNVISLEELGSGYMIDKVLRISEADRDLIAHAPNDLARLCDEVEFLRQQVEWLRGQLASSDDGMRRTMAAIMRLYDETDAEFRERIKKSIGTPGRGD
jgi:hypothetical protein